MQIYIATIEREAMLIEINEEAKVSDLKNIISAKIVGTKLTDQILKYKSKVLVDSDTIRRSEITENSVVELLIIRRNSIILKMPGDSKTHELEVDFGKNTDALNKQITKLLNIPTACQRLFVTELKNNDVLSNKMVGPGTTLHLYVLELNIKLNIVDVSDRFPIQLIEIPKKQNISELKRLISIKWNIPINHLSISYKDQILNNKTRLDAYNIPNMSNILVKQIDIEILVDVSSLGQPQIKLQMLSTDKVQYIKNKIKKRLNISEPFQKLIWNDTVLADRDILADIGIVSGSLLNLIPIIQLFKINILFGVLEEVTVETHLYETIAQLKQTIQLATNILSEQQILGIDGIELQNEKQVVDYPIKQESKLIMERQATFLINIETVTGFNITLRVHGNDQIRLLRHQLAGLNKRLGVQAYDHLIFFHGRLLNDDITLFAYGIEDGSNLILREN